MSGISVLSGGDSGSSGEMICLLPLLRVHLAHLLLEGPGDSPETLLSILLLARTPLPPPSFLETRAPLSEAGWTLRSGPGAKSPEVILGARGCILLHKTGYS